MNIHEFCWRGRGICENNNKLKIIREGQCVEQVSQFRYLGISQPEEGEDY